MWRVARSVFSRSRMRQPSMSGRKMSSVIADGWYSRVIASAPAPVRLTRPLKPLRARRVEQHLGEAEVVLDDQQHPVAGLDRRRGRRRPRWRTSRRRRAAAAGVERRRRHRRMPAQRRRGVAGAAAALGAQRPRSLAGALRAVARAARRVVALRQVQREGAALARRADQPDLAAEQARQLAADRQAQAGAAVLARGASRRPAGTPRR